MKRYFILFIACLFLAACDAPSSPGYGELAADFAGPEEITPGKCVAICEGGNCECIYTLEECETCPETPTATLYATETPEQASTPTFTAEPTSEGDLVTDELLVNPGFEGGVRSVVFPEINVFVGWHPFYCDATYTGRECPAYFAGSENPDDLIMGRPEFKPTSLDYRVHSGMTAQQWFNFYRVGDGGVWQTVNIPPGAVGHDCTVSAWVQTWSTNTGGKLESDVSQNSVWYIAVDPYGGDYPYTPYPPEKRPELIYREWGMEGGHYDQYARIELNFTAVSPLASVWFGNYRLWPFIHNDSYIDDASLVCGYELEITPTRLPPTPTVTPTATPVPTSTPGASPTWPAPDDLDNMPVDMLVGWNGDFVSTTYNWLWKRDCPEANNQTCPAVGQIWPNQRVAVKCLYRTSSDWLWGADATLCYSDRDNNQYFAIRKPDATKPDGWHWFGNLTYLGPDG